MRILKEHEERKNEILDIAEVLFMHNGYSKTTIMDIINEIGIAKGTFYYYFKSKEEVLDAIIMRIIDQDVEEAKKILANRHLSAVEKLFQILLSQNPKKANNEKGDREKMIKQFNNVKNSEMNQKVLVQTVMNLSPVLTEILQQGIQEGTFKNEYPRETTELLIVSSSTLFDDKLFNFTSLEIMQRAKAFVSNMEVLLGAQKGSFDYIIKMLQTDMGEEKH